MTSFVALLHAGSYCRAPLQKRADDLSCALSVILNSRIVFRSHKFLLITVNPAQTRRTGILLVRDTAYAAPCHIQRIFFIVKKMTL